MSHLFPTFCISVSHPVTSRSLFDETQDQIVQKAMDAIQIKEINYRDDEEMERVISIVIACDCISKGPFSLTAEQKKAFDDSLARIVQMIPRTSMINDYPKAVQLRTMIDKVRDDFLNVSSTMYISKVIDNED